MRIFKKCITTVLAATTALALITGCDRRSPDERLSAAVQFYQQGDALSAEMEALKVVEKAPEDPAAVQANMLLAQIYASQNRQEEAEIQLEAALAKVSQLDPMGKEVLRSYLGLLNSQKKYDKALEVVNKYQKEYAKDEGTSLSLTVAEVDIRTAAGETTQARALLQDIVDRTTAPAELSLYREIMMRTYVKDRDTTAAVAYMEGQLAQAPNEDIKQNIMLSLAGLYAAQDNYEKSRSYLEAVTGKFSENMVKEKNQKARQTMALELAQAYQGLGNLPGARRVLQTVYDTGTKDPQIVMATVLGLAENLLRHGETSATVSLLEDAAQTHPEAHFEQQLQRLQEMVAKGEIQHLAPEDTSTLAMKYRGDNNVLWPANLPDMLEKEQTTGTTTATTGTVATSGSTPGAPANETDYVATGAAPEVTPAISTDTSSITASSDSASSPTE